MRRHLAHHLERDAPGIAGSGNRGTFGSEHDALNNVVDTLVGALDPEAIWLFGSRAEGRNRPDSDFDLLVATKVYDGAAGHDYAAVYAPLRGLGVGCDVVPYRMDDFLEDVEDPTSLCFDVVRTGRKLHDRRPPQPGIHILGGSGTGKRRPIT